MDRQYTYTVDVSPQEGGYLVTVPALPGCQTWGNTHEEAVNSAQEAIQGYLETLTKLGKTIPVESMHRKLHLKVNLPAMA